MRAPRALIAISVALAVLVAACGSDDDTGGGGDDGNGGSDRTVSDTDWVRGADDACAKAQRAIDTIPSSTASLSDPENAEQLSQAGAYLGNLITHLEALVEDLDDMPQPASESDAAAANEVVDGLGKALASLRRAHDAAGSGDVAAYRSAYATYAEDDDAYARRARDAGLDRCGATAPA